MFEHYPDYEYTLASTQLALAMLGMGATLAPEDFARVARSPRALTLGLAVQWLVVPLIAAAVARVLGLEAGLAVGLVLVAAVPGGSMSNVAVYVGDGNVSLSISLTVVATLACLVTTPLILRVFCGAYLPSDFAMPYARVVFEIGLCLIAPLLLGMLVRRVLGRTPERFTRLCITLSLAVIALMVVGGVGSGRVDAGAYGWLAIGALAVTALAFCAAGVGAARATGLQADDAVAVAIEVTIRNTNLALLLKASLFPARAGVADPFADQVFFIALLYGGMAVPLAIPLLVLHRRGKRAAPAAASA